MAATIVVLSLFSTPVAMPAPQIPDPAASAELARYCSPEFRRFLIYLAKRQNLAVSGMSRAGEIQGWLELIDVFDGSRCDQVQPALLSWGRRHAEHTARSVFPDHFGQARGLAGDPLALFLPLQGRYRAQAEQILDSASREAERLRVRLMVYDTDSDSLEALYQQAVRSGARCIVGPLLKDRVQRFASLPPALPVLSLNYLPSTAYAPPRFFQMSLSPENEARALLEELIDKDRMRGLLFYAADSEWTRRVASSVRELFEAEGGEWGTVTAYGADLVDFSEVIKKHLRLDASERRYQTLQELLGVELEFVPRRRQDADFYVLIGQQRELAMLYPQMRYWHADDLPAYVISRDLEPGTGSLQFDLDGAFTLVPRWVREPALDARRRREQGLERLGADAVGIAYRTGCLRPGALFELNAEKGNWLFDWESGRFYYRLKAREVKNNRFQLRH